MDAVALYELTKVFGQVPALQRVSLHVPEGMAFACLAARGGGKTTLIRVLSGLSHPTSGECTVAGYSPFYESEKCHLASGTVLESAQLYSEMTLLENLRFHAGLNGIRENEMNERSSFLLHRLDIWDWRNEKVDDMPTGVLYRASLARALMHRPKVLLMDEPLEGPDPETAQWISGILGQLRDQEGLTVFLTTERPELAQSLCSRFGFLDKGVLVANGDFETLRQKANVRYRAELRLGEGHEGPKGFVQSGVGFWEKEIVDQEELARIIAHTVGEGTLVYEARLIRPGLKEVLEAVLMGGIQREEDEDESGSEENGEAQPAEAGDHSGREEP